MLPPIEVARLRTGAHELGTALAQLWPPVLLPEHVAWERDAILGGLCGERGGGPDQGSPAPTTATLGQGCPSPPCSPWSPALALAQLLAHAVLPVRR